jgi:hypothetical protein
VGEPRGPQWLRIGDKGDIGDIGDKLVIKVISKLDDWDI